MEKDLQKKAYFYVPERFADLINGVLCAGRQVVAPSDLMEMDSQTGQFDASGGRKRQNRKLKDRRRDLIRRAAFGVNFMVFGIENQEEVNYLMPLRCMSYDTEEYERQAAQIGRQVRQRKDITKAEFLSGFARESRVGACITVVLYYGKEWDGAADLHGILDLTGIPAELKDKVNNYSICLCEVRRFENTEVFRTDIKQLFDCVRYSEEPDKLYELVANDPAYREMEADTYDMIAQYTKTNELMQIKEYGKKEGKVDMCKAIAELIERGRRQGMEQGIEQVIRALIETSREFGSTKEETIGRIIEKMELSNDEAEMYVGRYWG